MRPPEPGRMAWRLGQLPVTLLICLVVLMLLASVGTAYGMNWLVGRITTMATAETTPNTTTLVNANSDEHELTVQEIAKAQTELLNRRHTWSERTAPVDKALGKIPVQVTMEEWDLLVATRQNPQLARHIINLLLEDQTRKNKR